MHWKLPTILRSSEERSFRRDQMIDIAPSDMQPGNGLREQVGSVNAFVLMLDERECLRPHAGREVNGYDSTVF